MEQNTFKDSSLKDLVGNQFIDVPLTEIGEFTIPQFGN